MSEETDLEDRWIAYQLWKRRAQFKGRLPFWEYGKLFSVDVIFYPDSFFCHKFWQVELFHQLVDRAKVLEIIAPIKTWYVEQERADEEYKE